MTADRFHGCESTARSSFLPWLRRIADQITEITEEFPISALILAPNLDAARDPAAFPLLRPHRAGPVIAHESEIAGREDLLRLKLNAPLSIGRRKRASVGIAQTCESIGRVPGV